MVGSRHSLRKEMGLISSCMATCALLPLSSSLCDPNSYQVSFPQDLALHHSNGQCPRETASFVVCLNPIKCRGSLYNSTSGLVVGIGMPMFQLFIHLICAITQCHCVEYGLCRTAIVFITIDLKSNTSKSNSNSETLWCWMSYFTSQVLHWLATWYTNSITNPSTTLQGKKCLSHQRGAQ